MSPVPTNYKHNLIRLSAPFWQQHTAPCVGGFQNAVSSQAKVKCRIFAHLLCTVPCLLPGAFLCILKYLISLAYHHPHRFGLRSTPRKVETSKNAFREKEPLGPGPTKNCDIFHSHVNRYCFALWEYFS